MFSEEKRKELEAQLWELWEGLVSYFNSLIETGEIRTVKASLIAQIILFLRMNRIYLAGERSEGGSEDGSPKGSATAIEEIVKQLEKDGYNVGGEEFE